MNLRTALVAGLLSGVVTGASATVVNISGETPNLQTLINSLYELDPALNPSGTNCDPDCSPVSAAPNVNTNQATEDGLFQIEASGVSAQRLIFEITAPANAAFATFGIYNPSDITQRLTLLNGAATAGTPSVVIGTQLLPTDPIILTSFFGNLVLPSNVFGFFLTTVNGTYFSQSSLNTTGVDMMVAYQGDGDRIRLPGAPAGPWGSSSFILAWEDWNNRQSDYDYNDFGVYVESIAVVPAPGVLALLGAGLLGIGALRRRS